MGIKRNSKDAAKRAAKDAATCRTRAAKDARIAELERHLLEARQTLKRAERERDEHESRADLQDTIIPPLEEQRRDLQEQVTEVARQLIELDVPMKRQRISDVPFYYRGLQVASDRAKLDAPWNTAEKRPMTPAEGVRWACARPT